MSAIAKKNYKSPEELRRAFSSLRDEVKDRYRIDTALRDVFGMEFQGRGNELKACCPFHVETTPSFNVTISRGRYRCFGNGCDASGDVFELIQETQNLDFRQAVIWGADRAGIMVDDELRDSRLPRMAPSKPRKIAPVNPILQVPAGQKSFDFHHIEGGMRRPRAGQLFRVWKNGGRDKQGKFENVFYRPEMVHEYKDIDGNMLMSVLRLRFQDGRKFFIPVRLGEVDGNNRDILIEKTENGRALAFINEGPPDEFMKPVYGTHRAKNWDLHEGTDILIVEGEKTCDAAARMIRDQDKDIKWLVISPMGGGSATIYADWGPIIAAAGDRKVRITIWPDADKLLVKRDGSTVDRVEKYVKQVSTSLTQAVIDAGKDPAQFTIQSITPPPGVESGWDLADAREEGWSPQLVREYIETYNSEVTPDMLNLRAIDPTIEDVAAKPREEGELIPFDKALSTEDDEALWAEVAMENENAPVSSTMNDDDIPDIPGAAPAEPGADAATIDDVMSALGIDTEAEILTVEAVAPAGAARATPEAEATNPEQGAIVDNDDEDVGPEENPILANSFFRCLGYRDQLDYFMSLTSGQVFALSPRQLKQEYLLHLAPLEWWQELYAKADMRGNPTGIDWTRAANDLIQNCYAAGVWEPRLQVSQGARMDGRRVVFNTGSRLYIEGEEGTRPLWDFQGRYCFTVGPTTKTPSFDAPFAADAPEVWKLLRIIQSIAWRDGSKEISVLSLFGWMMISPICGILKWRPHLWIDGPRSSGKSWIVNNIVIPALGDYAEQVVSNSSESGIRNLLNGRSVPIIFDEAEGEGQADRARMDAILRLARHSAVESNSVVAQGVSGGGASRYFSMASTFLMTSIMPQLEAAADKTRFARARLGTGRDYEAFAGEIEGPAYELLQEEVEINGNYHRFADRIVARMIMRAGDYEKTYRSMVQAFSRLGYERRIADVYGTFAAGAWLALRDDCPESVEDAVMWIASTFEVIQQIQEMNDELQEEKDHLRVFREISVQEQRFETRNAGARTYQIGDLIAVAAGLAQDEDIIIAPEEARDVLRRIGIKPGIEHDACPAGSEANTVLVHRNSPALRKMMENTPYARSFIDVMHQAENVKIGSRAQRFGPALGAGSKPLVVPIRYFVSMS